MVGHAKPDAAFPLLDGRQSDAARDIARGCGRLLARLGLASLPEFTLPSGRRADLAALTMKGEIWILEVKSSLSDFESDSKWPEYGSFCDRFFFAVAPEFPIERLPDDTGLIVADRYGGEIIRDGKRDAVPAARRRTIQLLFARTAAARLQRLADPEFTIDPLSGG
ncbi:MAG: MmcB family DNA repair protein [Pseudomonadota bacterium]